MKRFMKKEEFLSSVSNFFSVDGAIMYDDDLQHHGEILTEDLVKIIHPNVFISMLQGFINISVDSRGSIFVRYKLLSCAYDASSSVCIPFPLSNAYTEMLTQFFAYIPNLIDKKVFENWSKEFSNVKITAGRKRKYTCEQVWLLTPQQEQSLLSVAGFLKTDFTEDERDIAVKIGNAFPFIEDDFADILLELQNVSS